MIRMILILLTLAGFSFPGDMNAAQVLKVAFLDDLQPWVLKEGDRYGGVYPLLIQALAQQTGMRVEFIPCPVKRCEVWLQKGEADMVIGLKDTPERKTFLEFLSTPYRFGSAKVFYLKKGEGHKLQNYADLYKLTVGIKLGAKYFKPFDGDAGIRKQEVVSEEQNFQKLIMGRIDAAIIPEDRGEYLLSRYHYRAKLEKAPYVHHDGSPRFIGISKKSAHIGNVAKFNAAMQAIAENGTLDRLYLEHFFKKFNVPRENYQWK